MASLKTLATVTMVLALLNCLAMARELHHIDHLAPESVPSDSSAYATLPVDATDLGPSPSTYNQEECGQGGMPGFGGSGGGMPYGGAGSGGGMQYGGAGSGGGMQYSGAGSGGGMQHSAAGSGSSFVYPVALSALLLVAGLVYF